MAFPTRKMMSAIPNATGDECWRLCGGNYCERSCIPYCPDICQFDEHLHPHKYNLFLITILSILGAVLAGILCALCVKLYLSPSRRGEEERNEVREEFTGEDQGSLVDHHVWYINTIGLQPSIISSITVCRYKKGEGIIEGTECSVCLNEFQDGEALRLLPKCSHAFHIPCIDTWLGTHVNCPMCRSPIVARTAGEGTPSEMEDQMAIEESLVEDPENNRESSDEMITEGSDSICEGGENLLNKAEKNVDGANWGMAGRRSISLDISSSSNTKHGGKCGFGAAVENDTRSVQSSVARSFSSGGKSF